MTTPGGSAPDGAYVVGSKYGSDVTEDSVRAITRGAIGGFESAQDSWHGLTSDLADLADEIRDGQLDLMDRIDLLEGVYGYCNLFMSQNWLVAQQQLLTLPFDTQLGPSVGAVPLNGGIKLQHKGLWRADTLVSFDAVSGTTRAEVYITVWNTTTDMMYSETRFDIVLTNAGSETAAFSKTFVIPTDNTYAVTVRVKHYSSSRARVFGGTLRSALSVNKWSTNTDNNVDIPVAPDGGELG